MLKFLTPSIPNEIKNLSHPHYKNIYSFNLGNQNLWGTESLFGDWNGRYLLIAQDFYPTCYIDQAVAARDPLPYRHNSTAPSNLTLQKILRAFEQIPPEPTPPYFNTRCGFLYISACFLLRADGLKRGRLPKLTEVLNESWAAVEFTIQNMPRLEHVVLMGEVADKARRLTPLGDLLRRKGLNIYRVHHPAARLSWAQRTDQWRHVFRCQSPTTPMISMEVTELANSGNRSADIVLGVLTTYQQLVDDLSARTGLSEDDVRDAIDYLRHRICIWNATRVGFWVDSPLCTDIPQGGSDRWKKAPPIPVN